MTEKPDDEMERLINRLEEALEIQNTTEGKRVTRPTVEYCFECDEITVDELPPDDCLYHPTVMSDGYEHGGIQSSITTLRYLLTDKENDR